MTSTLYDFFAAVRFLTRVPMPASEIPDSLPRAVKFFPLVGAMIGAVAALFHALLVRHLSRPSTALFTVVLLVMLTGCFHEDGLADAADGFGGGWTRERVLLIMRDSRIGSYGGAALILSLLARIALLSSLPAADVTAYLISAHALCRWTTLPLSYFLPPAREDAYGLGAQVAKLTNLSTLIFGTVITLVMVIGLLRLHAIVPICVALALTFLSGRYYQRRIQGVTGDCFGATNQLTEIGVYLCGAWIA